MCSTCTRVLRDMCASFSSIPTSGASTSDAGAWNTDMAAATALALDEFVGDEEIHGALGGHPGHAEAFR